MSTVRFFVVAMVLATLTAARPSWSGEPENVILGPTTFWRWHFALKPPVLRKDGQFKVISIPEEIKGLHKKSQLGKWLDFDTPLPPENWREPDFDDVDWHRRFLVDPDSPWIAHVALRGKFSVTDPAQAQGLVLALSYRGGIAVFLNGREIARQHVTRMARPEDLAEDYTEGDFAKPRELSIELPQSALRKGINVLGVEVHRSPQAASGVNHDEWRVEIPLGTCGVISARLTASKGAAVQPNFARPAEVQVWNSGLMQEDYECDYGDPNEQLKPIRIVATLGGVGSGKAVVGWSKPIQGLSASAGEFRRVKGDGRIAKTTVEVRYALPSSRGRGADLYMLTRSDALDVTPPEELGVRTPNLSIVGTPGRVAVRGAIVPVWVTIQVPPETAPGDYIGDLALNLPDGKQAGVPIALTVCPWRVPDPTAYRMFVEIVQSPESVAACYRVPLWSDRHFELMEKSFALLRQVGNCTCYVPLICDTNLGNDETMVRWIKQPDGSYKHDLTILQKYLDMVVKIQGRPKVVCLYVWDTYLEGGLSGRHPGGDDIVESRKKQMDCGPLVSMQDGAGAAVQKSALPKYSSSESRKLWEPMLKDLRRWLESRGLVDVMMWGCFTDHVPTQEVVNHFRAILPDVPWVCHAHQLPSSLESRARFGYRSIPYIWATTMFCTDPSVARLQGWKEEKLLTHFARYLGDEFCPTTWRFLGEANATGVTRGFSRIGGDFLTVLDSRGKGGRLINRFPKTSWRMLNMLTAVLSAGKDQPVATARFEILREGLQETEARIFVEDALIDPTKRAKLGETFADQCQRLLDDRTRNAFRAISTLKAKKKSSFCYTGDSWWNNPPFLGNCWFCGTPWQADTIELYETAAKVAEKLK